MARDMELIRVQPAQRYVRDLFGVKYGTVVEATGGGYTFEDGNVIYACLGVVDSGFGIGQVWAMLAESIGRRFVVVHRFVQRFLDAQLYRRLEATVDVGHDEGHRWMKMLGFQHEGLMRAWRPDGADMHLYARIRT